MVANCSSRRLPVPTLPGIDAVLVERARAVGIARQQQVAVVVEVADERGGHAGVEHPLLDFRDGCRRFGQVDRDAHHLRARLGQLDALRGRRRCVGGVRHGHRLDDDRRAAADLDGADANADRLVQLDHWHGRSILSSGLGVRRFGARRPATRRRDSAIGTRRSTAQDSDLRGFAVDKRVDGSLNSTRCRARHRAPSGRIPSRRTRSVPLMH